MVRATFPRLRPAEVPVGNAPVSESHWRPALDGGSDPFTGQRTQVHSDLTLAEFVVWVLRFHTTCAGKTGDVLWVEVPYAEGLATHGGSESCALTVRGRVKVDRGLCRHGIEPRNE